MSRDKSVPYDDLKAAVAKAEELFPGADKYVPIWYGGQTLVEVWNDGHAKVHTIELRATETKRRGR